MSSSSSIPSTTRQWLFNHPLTSPETDLSSLFTLSERPLKDDGGSDKVIVKTRFISNDPTQISWIRGDSFRSYMEPIRSGDPMRAWGIGEILTSTSDKFSPGDLVFGFLNWSMYNIFYNPTISWKGGLRKVPPAIHPADYLAFSITGLTAYIGLYQVGQPKPTDKVVVVSAAAGATGNIVIQIAKKILGIQKVIGIAGGEEKCKIVKEVAGADYALDYKSPTFRQEFQNALGEDGTTIDIYFDNVGGNILNLCLRNMSKYGRVVACGAISTYKAVISGSKEEEHVISPRSWVNIVTHSLTIKGFILSDYSDKIAEANRQLYEWYEHGKIKPLKTVWKAKFEEVPRGLESLFNGKNVGKLVTELID